MWLAHLAPCQEKYKQEVTGASSASAPGSNRMAWRQHGQGASLKPSPQKKENKPEKRRALSLHHPNVSCEPGGGGHVARPTCHIFHPLMARPECLCPRGGGGNVARPTCHTYHPPCPDHGGGTKTPPHSTLGCLDKWGSTSTANSCDMQ